MALERWTTRCTFDPRVVNGNGSGWIMFSWSERLWLCFSLLCSLLLCLRYPAQVSFCFMKKARKWDSCHAQVTPRTTS